MTEPTPELMARFAIVVALRGAGPTSIMQLLPGSSAADRRTAQAAASRAYVRLRERHRLLRGVERREDFKAWVAELRRAALLELPSEASA